MTSSRVTGTTADPSPLAALAGGGLNVHEFAGAGPPAAVVFTRNTTDAFKLLARCLAHGSTVIGFEADHPAALVAWQRSKVCRLRAPTTPGGAVAAVDAAPRAVPTAPALVSIGIGTAFGHVDRIARAHHRLAAMGAHWTDAERDGRFRPDPGPRAWPSLPVPTAAEALGRHDDR